MKIALDAMGGDHAPRAMVLGAIDYAHAQPGHTVILVGREAELRSCLGHELILPANVVIEHASEVIGMGDKIAALKEKPDDSMNRCARLVKEGRADAMVLCGNTGCSVAAAQLHLRRIPGVKRAGILTPMPNPKGRTWVCDCGANAVNKPEHLAQYAEMTVAFLQGAYGMANPRVGVLSIGEEEGKGTELTDETVAILSKSGLNFAGLVEGHDIYSGDLDVVVCDGFTGNVMLKTSEGVFDAINRILKEEIHGSARTKLGYVVIKPAFDALRERAHWSKVGGCLLIGVDGVTIIGHGRSDRVAVFHALQQAARCVDGKVMTRLREKFRTTVGAAD